MFQTSLITELRRAISDVHSTFQCLTLGVSDRAVTSAILEVTSGHLILTVAGGTTRSFDLDLTLPTIDTIGKLADNLARMPGITANLDNDVDPSFPSLEIESFGPVDARVQGVALRHRVFSDQELHIILSEATTRHNPSFTVQTLPLGERALVLHLAQAAVLRRRAQDSAKRRGTTTTTADFLSLAQTFENLYRDDSRRLQRVIQSPKEPLGHRVMQGDVLLGSLYRRSLRTGRMAPGLASVPPPPVVLHEPDDQDEGDVNVRVRWERPNNTDATTLELWMDTRPNVMRSLGTPSPSSFDGYGPDTDEIGELRATTSTLAWRGSGPTFAASAGGSWVVSAVQSQHHYVVPELEPETSYYFRVYLFNVNGEFSESSVVEFRTKALRARFRETNPLSVTSGVAGATVTAYLDADWGTFTSTHSMTLGGKALVVVIVAPREVTFTVPTFVHVGLKSLVLTSPTGLTHSVTFEVL